MTNEQKSVLNSIKEKIALAEVRNNKTKTAEMHMQFLINASILESLNLQDTISYLELNDSFTTELRQMINLYKQLKDNAMSIVKTL
jgi:hypothetical protein